MVKRPPRRTTATAPGKIILFGEHAVVYGRPAIAAPLTQVRATVVIRDLPGANETIIEAPDIGHRMAVTAAPPDDPLAAAVRLVARFRPDPLPPLHLHVTTTIPIASGLGSGAAVATAMLRALAAHLDVAALQSPAALSAAVYDIERLHHGTPSGIDNTVVVYERPIYFIRATPENDITPLPTAAPLHVLVADSGRRSSTRDVVGDVRRQWLAEPDPFEWRFDGVAAIVVAARAALATGDTARLGRLMDANHTLLQELTVSDDGLDQLVLAARSAGALGAKMSGAGRGGNVIALVTDKTALAVDAALRTAGATAVLATHITPNAKNP